MLRASTRRSGVVLLVVISLLMLFAIVGIAFVIYAEAQATTARIRKESESQRLPDMDPEMLLSFFLGQLIYGTDNPQSALRGHDLARNMYGKPGGTIAFNGTGRTGASYSQVDYSDGRDPDQESLNPPYTYPDNNHMYLAAQRGSDGKVLMPSFYRNDQAQLRAKGLPPMPPSGDVKNIADGAGFRDGPNDSVWIDIGAPVMTGTDGRKFKALFAPLIVDLDGRVNLNVAGMYDLKDKDSKENWPDAGGAPHLSHQGWGPWEINPQKLVSGDKEISRLVAPATVLALDGRYKKSSWQSTSNMLVPNALIIGRSRYSPTDVDCRVTGTPPTIKPERIYPQNLPLGKDHLDNGNHNDYHAHRNHPAIYNVFNPDYSPHVWGAEGAVRDKRGDRRFPAASMEALVRYQDIGSPALSADPFFFTSKFSNPLARRLSTTDSYDVVEPGRLGPLSPDGPLDKPQSFIEINRSLRSYPNFSGTEGANNKGGNLTSYRNALQDRQEMAQEIYDLLLQLTATPPDGDPAQRRRLGQLAANIVDYRDEDDYNTPFCWDQAQKQQEAGWVFGVELPRVVLSEVYTEVADNSARNRKEVRFWVELLNTLEDARGDHWTDTQVIHRKVDPPWDTTLLGEVVLAKSFGFVRLQMSVPSESPTVGTACYQLLVCKTAEGLDDPANVRGEPRGEIKLKVKNYKKASDFQLIVDRQPKLEEQEVRNAFNNANKKAIEDKTNPLPGQPPFTPQEIDQIIPTLDIPSNTRRNQRIIDPKVITRGDYNGLDDGYDRGNKLYYMLAPERDKPNVSSDPEKPNPKPNYGDPNHEKNKNNTDDNKNWSKPTLCLADGNLGSDPDPANPPNAMAYGVQAGGAEPAEHTLVLQKLCCQYLNHDPDPKSPTYNPYITVDYLKDVPVRKDGDANRSTVGKKQPNASAVVTDQTTPDRWGGGPNHTFIKRNTPAPGANNPYHWLTFMDRPLISPIELLQTPGVMPHQLTQKFIDQGNPFQHLTPWLDETAQLYRVLGFFHTGMRSPESGMGARVAGKININSIWDREVFEALCDANLRNTFKDADVKLIFDKMMQHRSPQYQIGGDGGPDPNADRPFLPLSAPPLQDQYPTGMGLDHTVLARSPIGPGDPDLAKAELLFRHPTAGAEHPYYQLQLLNKIHNSMTTRSNVFAIWLTVGFFEVLDEGGPGTPARLGEEINLATGRHQRHRMFAVIDRTSLTLDPMTPGQTGERPWFITTTVTADPNADTIDVSRAKGIYDGTNYKIEPGQPLVIGPGGRQEIVTVVSAGPGGADGFDRIKFKPPLQRRHSVGTVVTNVGMATKLGNPGPQRHFDVRNPRFGAIVRYFSILI